ncbi:hypothetical protein [Nitrosophilus alvini]|uniref:hypothetical protein n=1 Tax=Nitrosophilus alvini TaxID=2714855 RepID=UPI00190B3373|nr:hypothetical protein [Nitrosophilus alvini]
MLRITSFFLMLFFFSGCSLVYNTEAPKITKTEKFVILPFANFTQTPMAGYRVAGIAEGVFKSYGLVIKGSLWDIDERDYTLKEIREMIKKMEKNDTAYIITGYVNEYRYKTGIDGEPAVSITLKIYDTVQKKYIWGSVASKTGWSYQSVSTIAHELLNEMAYDMIKRDKERKKLSFLFF